MEETEKWMHISSRREEIQIRVPVYANVQIFTGCKIDFRL